MYTIYLAGGMSGISFEESNNWRESFDALINILSKARTINPNYYYNFKEVNHKSEKEIREFDLHKVRTADLVFVNFNAPNSIGTAQELAIAYELKIPIIGLHENKIESLHPWLIECCTRICDTMDEAADHIAAYYIN